MQWKIQAPRYRATILFLTRWPLFRSQPILTRDAELTCKARNILPLCFPKSNCLPRINTTNALCTLRLPTAWSYHEVHFRRIQFPFGLDHTAKHVRSRLFACTQKSKRFRTEWKAKRHRSFTCYDLLDRVTYQVEVSGHKLAGNQLLLFHGRTRSEACSAF